MDTYLCNGIGAGSAPLSAPDTERPSKLGTYKSMNRWNNKETLKDKSSKAGFRPSTKGISELG
ncbi:uncharacterized protein FRV6_05324 [Fusarium oxysporum]|uniref:Uncharacterized protein n=1 Tax=Fusarium oxysporum TaxID=5507 RepID=A0A2H3SY68_FUSOX|nr:uncharacterized protein FRV6_05324 [Fusarium oxysporum]